jgi:hypothetical protein
MLALANESYYGTQPPEREALATEAVAMARRLDEPALLLWALISGFLAIWRGVTAPERLELITEAAQLARELGDEVHLAAALTLRTVVLGELGRVAEMDDELVRARALAGRTRHLYCDLVLDSLEVPWRAMRGEHAEVARVIDHIVGLGQTMAIPQFEEAVTGAIAMQLLWEGRQEEMLGALAALDGTTYLPTSTTMMAMLCRAGRVDEARTYQADHLEEQASAIGVDTWFSPMGWSMAAEAASGLGDRSLAAGAYERLIGLAGRPCCAGSGSAIGPVDMFLAMAAATTGELELARRHAERAEQLCAQWRVPLAAQWVRDERDRLGV